ncbi:hypothetical protein CGI50_24055 [Vibrio parahaemolyticus]|nr:hypothetical protein CGJ00_24390 [Vibrio parahaemolyticus]TOH01763.1 hypothetical protein CGI90_25205 [Vibrio parahaemolyticus]TOI86828.1 hypothetical protein CGI50_24055 [Vibrio parahaemolyticus]TON64556.1 hypothetical protein CGH53_23620 [Vibrio parahaemolyticus]TOP59610.1 hypothetical protein CGH13_22330 [Vibrio parahaemolyticus]
MIKTFKNVIDVVFWEGKLIISPNAVLSGEQRIPLHLKYCAVNTKDEANRKCRALGIRLKRLVIPLG